uniref:Uncharacterized protein n=1 Tax=Peronospora matthiolae TaxID=2874970 RepID=A0AAV1V463_9STRA
MATCAYDGNSPSPKTPVGFDDSPSQWYTANRRKRAALSAMDEEPTQPYSQVTQAETKMTSASERTGAPRFVFYEPPEEKEDGVKEKNRWDEEATRIWMTNSVELKGASRLTSLSEEIVSLQKTFAVDEDTDIGASDDDAESDMSDDMLEQVGSIAAPSLIAGSLQKRTRTMERLKRICILSTPLRESTALSSHDTIGSSGGETEIEAEPKEESPAKFHVHLSEKQTISTDGMQSNVVRGVSFPKVASKGNLPNVERKSVGQSMSTTKKTHELTSPSRRSNREKRQACKGKHLGTDRFRRDRDDVLSHSSYLPDSLIDPEGKECSDEDVPYAHAETHGDFSEAFDDQSQDILDDEADQLDMFGNTSSHTASRSPRKSPTTCHGTKRTHCLGKQAQGGSISIIFTGLEPTAVIRKKINLIAGVFTKAISKRLRIWLLLKTSLSVR